MNTVKQRIATLEAYLPPLTAHEDIHEFWEDMLQQFAHKPLNAKIVYEQTPLTLADAYAVTYEGFDDTPIHGWFMRPKHIEGGKAPCVVIFHGYSGSKGYPEHHAQWLLMGYCVFAVDVRGQGGETGNRLAADFGMISGWVSQGILDKRNSYYAAIAIDSLKAVEWVSGREEVDIGHIYLEGTSQGGGLVLLTAALSDIPALVVANVPNLCHMDYGILHSNSSLSELARFVTLFPDKLDAVLETISYFDIMNLAERIRVPVMISVGLKDTVCMPETIYAAYNRLKGAKEIHPYPFMGHAQIGYHNRLGMEFMERYRRSGSPTNNQRL